MSGAVGVGEVNWRPKRRDEAQAHLIEGELEPAARGREARRACSRVTDTLLQAAHRTTDYMYIDTGVILRE